MVRARIMGEKPRLTGTLIELGLCSPKDLDEALARQLIFGGTLELALLESDCVDEAGLLRALAAQTGLPVAQAGPLPVHAERSLTLQPQAPGLVVGEQASELVVFSDSPLSPDVLRLVEEHLGVAAQNHLTSELRLIESLAFLGVSQLPDRLERQLARTGRRLVSTLSAPPLSEPGSPSEALPMRSSLPEQASLPSEPARLQTEQYPTIELRSAPPNEETAPPPADYETVRRSVAPPAFVPPHEPAPSSEPRAADITYRRVDAERDLLACRDRDRIIYVILDYCAQFFDYTAVFAVHAAEARGLSSRGPGASPESVSRLHVPLDLPSAFGRVKDTGTHRVARLRASGVEGGILRDLERPAGRAVLLIPINVRGRTLLLVWGDHGDADVDIERSSAALELAPAAGRAIEKILLERKRASRVAETGSSSAPSEAPRSTPPISPGSLAPQSLPPPSLGSASPRGEVSAADSAALGPPSWSSPAGPTEIESGALATASKERAAGAGSHGEPEENGPEDARSPTERGGQAPRRTTQLGMSLPPASRHSLRSQQADATVGTSAGTPELAQSSPPPLEEEEVTDAEPRQVHEVAPAKRRPLSDSPAEKPAPGEAKVDFSSDHPKTIKGYPTDMRGAVAGASSVPPSPAPRVAAPLLSRRIVPLAERSSASSSEHPSADRGTPEQHGVAPTKRIDRSKTLVSRSDLPFSADGKQDDRGGAPVERPSRSVHPTSPPRSARLEDSYEGLVRRWLQGDVSALTRLVDGGEAAVGALITQFPGPVREPDSPQTPASECGPILRALAQLSARAAPFVTVRTADENPEVRRWAVLLLGELPGRDSARCIAERLLDDSVLVRRAALSSARRVQSDSLTRRALRARLEEMLRDGNLQPEERSAAIEAIADIREQLSIPALLGLLTEDSAAVQRSSRWALSVLTRRDFETDVTAWRKFWQEHRNESRAEWLHSALLQEDEHLQQAAAEELSALLEEPVELPLDETRAATLLEKIRARPELG